MLPRGSSVNGNLPASITRLASKESIEEEGILSQGVEAALELENASGVGGAAANTAAEAAGKPSPAKQVAGVVNKAESAGVKTTEKAGNALTGWVGEITGWLGEHAIRGLLDFVLVLLGGVLVVAGILIALRPRERAMAVPV